MLNDEYFVRCSGYRLKPSMAEAPKVAVVIAAYNAEDTLVLAVESILAGTLECRVYVVDDCSRIPAANSLQHLLDRVVLIRLDSNVGPAAARNVALQSILDDGFEYVAIADADDISAPTRLQKQLEFMEARPRVGVCGTWVSHFRARISEDIFVNRRPGEPDKVRNLMFFNMPVSHASAMIRCEALRRVGLYSTDYPVAEDYELFRRIATQYDLANVSECLLYYRLSPMGQSLTRRKRQLYDRFRIQLKYFEAANWRAWGGLARTAVTFLVPRDIIQSIRTNSQG